VAREDALRNATRVDLSWLRRPLTADGWEVAPDLLRLLDALVERLRPRHVVEFGSGVSTVVLARVAARVGGCRVTSLDHDPQFIRASAEALAGVDGEQCIALQLAPLVARSRAGRLGPEYLVDAARLASPLPAELVLIDGPPAVLGGRAGMLYQALDYVQAGSIVLLDDAARASECAALDAWHDRLGDAIRISRPEGFAKGLAAIVVAAPTTAQIRIAGTTGGK
jgi:predicted O-methyltransferase YrrM